MFEILPYAAAAVGLFVALSGVRQLIATRRFEARASSTGAVVIDVREEWVSGTGKRGNRRLWIPVVRFTTSDGRTVQGETTPQRGYFGHPESGETLEVLYDPADPGDVRLRSGAGGLLSTLSSVAGGIAVAVVALTVFR